MTTASHSETDPKPPSIYQIRLRGRLGSHWSEKFAGLAIEQLENGDTLLTGPVVDQASLFGLLRTIRDLGLPLISVIRLDPDQPQAEGGT